MLSPALFPLQRMPALATRLSKARQLPGGRFENTWIMTTFCAYINRHPASVLRNRRMNYSSEWGILVLLNDFVSARQAQTAMDTTTDTHIPTDTLPMEQHYQRRTPKLSQNHIHKHTPTDIFSQKTPTYFQTKNIPTDTPNKSNTPPDTWIQTISQINRQTHPKHRRSL